MKKRSFAETAVFLVAHLTVILGVDLLVLLVIDVFFNHAMNFLGSDFFRYGCMAFIVCSLLLAVLMLSGQRRPTKE